jgi:ABC-type multidrug transport system ATPase subunit
MTHPVLTSPVLEIVALSANYGVRRVLSAIDLSIDRGDWFCLHGPNGSGKTTLLRCVSGQITPPAGEVRVGGHSLREVPERAKHLLGYTHAPEVLPSLLTGYQCLEVYAAAHELSAIGERTLQLAQELRLTPALRHPVATYSLGMRQKLSLLLALVGDPALLVLDEAFNGLDPSSARIVKHELHTRVLSQQCAVLLATHALDITIQHATGAALLLDGRIVQNWDRAELAANRGDAAALELAFARAAEAN